MMVERRDPSIQSRTAGLFPVLHLFDFPGVALPKLETFKRGVSRVEVCSGGTSSDNMRIGVVINRATSQRNSSLVRH